jgi:hypothetical protein
LVFRQENSGLSNLPLKDSKTTNRKKGFFIVFAAALTVTIAVVAALLVPQSLGSPMQLGLNYQIGDHMVYETTNFVTNQMVNTSLSLPGVTNSQSFNSSITIDVVGSNSENYTVKEAITTLPKLTIHPLPAITLNVSKASYYNNFMAPGGPLIFYNSSSNPTISAYLAQPSVKVGDVWKIPVNTGNESLGLTGEVTLTFAGMQDLTVPAGTFQTMRIEVTSNVLSLHSDGSSIIKVPNGMTLQLNGTSYIEQGTCRLIKADLTQLTTTNTPGIGSTSTLYTEKTLAEYSKP